MNETQFLGKNIEQMLARSLKSNTKKQKERWGYVTVPDSVRSVDVIDQTVSVPNST